MMPRKREFLGDGVYAIHDGYGVWLHANDFNNPTAKIYLDADVQKSLVRFCGLEVPEGSKVL